MQISLNVHAVWSAPLLFAEWHKLTCYLIQNFKTLPTCSFCSWEGRFDSFGPNPQRQVFSWMAHICVNIE